MHYRDWAGKIWSNDGVPDVQRPMLSPALKITGKGKSRIAGAAHTNTEAAVFEVERVSSRGADSIQGAPPIEQDVGLQQVSMSQAGE
jgi:hypothetical protein